MMNLYSVQNAGLTKQAPGQAAIDSLWIDLSAPTEQEEKAAETLLGFNIPTRDELREIEESSRLYEEKGALFMTGIIIAGITANKPFRSEIGFVLSRDHLVTIRYADPLPFKTFEQKCSRKPQDHTSSDMLFVSLVEEIVARGADVLEKITVKLDDIAAAVFSEEGAPPPRKAGSRR